MGYFRSVQRRMRGQGRDIAVHPSYPPKHGSNLIAAWPMRGRSGRLNGARPASWDAAGVTPGRCTPRGRERANHLTPMRDGAHGRGGKTLLASPVYLRVPGPPSAPVAAQNRRAWPGRQGQRGLPVKRKPPPWKGAAQKTWPPWRPGHAVPRICLPGAHPRAIRLVGAGRAPVRCLTSPH